MNKREVAGIALLGVAGYLAWRAQQAQYTLTGAGVGPKGPPPNPGSLDDNKIYLDYCVQDANTIEGGKYVLSTTQPDAIDVAAERAQLSNGQSMYGRTLGTAMWRIYHQVWLPASRVKAIDIQPYHFQLANGMLSGILSRDDASGRLYINLLNDVAQNKKDAQDLQTTNTFLTAVATVIPVVGGALALATSTGLKQGIAGDVQNITQDMNAVSAINSVKAGLGVGSPDGKAWLTSAGSEFPIDQKWVHADNGVQINVCSIGLTELGGFYYDTATGESVGQDIAKYSVVETKNGVTQSVSKFKPGYAWQSVSCRMRFFSMHNYGWILPWLSPNLGSGQGPRRQIAIISPVLRALDYMVCSQDPVPPPMKTDGGDPDRYWYNSPIFGNVCGSVFPPDKNQGDRYIKFADGRTCGFHGNDISQALINEESTLVTPTLSEAASLGSTMVGSQQGSTTSPTVGEDYGQAAALKSTAAITTVVTPSTGAPSKPASLIGRYR